MIFRIMLLFAIVVATSPAQDVVVPVESEPHHKTVLKNAYLQVFRVTLEPGKTGLMHIHAHDDAGVRLSNAVVAVDSPGQPVGPPQTIYPGFVDARDNELKPTIHRVHNIGTTLYDVVDVQILSRPPGPSTEPIVQPAAESSKMRVYRYELASGESSSQHAHKRPYLLVAGTDVNFRMTSPGGESVEHSLTAGDMRWIDTATSHALTNNGRDKAILVEFEIK